MVKIGCFLCFLEVFRVYRKIVWAKYYLSKIFYRKVGETINIRALRFACLFARKMIQPVITWSFCIVFMVFKLQFCDCSIAHDSESCIFFLYCNATNKFVQISFKDGIYICIYKFSKMFIITNNNGLHK